MGAPALYSQQEKTPPAKSPAKAPAKAPAKKAPVRRRFTPAQTRIEPARVKDIQTALIREGFLKEPATGKWDQATERAMSDYQRKNGFNVTGKPDAKSLKKLGL